MKLKLLRQLYYMSRLAFYSIIIQITLGGMLIAGDLSAQLKSKSLEEINWNLRIPEASLDEVLSLVQSETGFSFALNENLVNKDQRVKVKFKKGTLGDLLRALSKETNIKFKRINDQIHVATNTGRGERVEDKYESIKADLTITGKITNENGQGLPGASVVQKGTTNGTITDLEGNYKLTIPEGAIITISFVGYVTQEILVGAQSVINVQMEPDFGHLEEVVVIGYGTTLKKDLTGAVSSVSSEDIQKVSVANTTNLLQGRAAGVRVENNGGAPGAGTNVVIRGTGTFGNDQPLYVVDGNIVDGIDFLNPNDIQDISILKDAAAAAIYGNRAANGVVLVTTKKGLAGDLRINFESRHGIQSPTNMLDFVNAREYADWNNQARDNDGDPRAPGNDTEFDPTIDTDEQDLSINNALYQDYSLSLSGGGENATFYISGQYLDQEGIVVDSDFKRYNFSVNTNMTKGKFIMGQSLTFSRSEDNPNNFFGQERGSLPTTRIFNEDNEGGFGGVDPLFHGVARGINFYGRALLNENLFTTDRVIGTIAPEFEIIDGLTYKLNLGLNYSVFNAFQFEPTFFLSNSDQASNDLAILEESTARSLGTLIENTLNYTKTIGEHHNLNVLLGITKQDNSTRSVGGIGTDFDFNEFRVLDAANVDTDVLGALQENSLISYLGRVNYDYKGKYLFGGTIRRDGSSRFSKENRWAVFPSVSAGWLISEEEFFPSAGVVSFMKLRGSYGELGSQNIGNFETVSTVNITNFYNFGGSLLSGAIVRQLANSDLVWETTKTTNFAVDANILDGRISFTAEYFIKKSEDILAEIPIPTTGGIGQSLLTNAATIENRGFEFLASYHHVAKDLDGLSFNASLNFTTINNEVLELGENVNPIFAGQTTQGQTSTRTDVGQPVGSFFGHVTEGLYQNQSEIDADGRTDAQLGDINYVDLDNDGDIDDDDRTFLGSPIPDFEFGLNLDVTYKNFDFTLFIQGVQGLELWNGKRFAHILDGDGGTKLTDVTNAWTPENPNTDIPRATIRDLANNRRASDFYIEDGSYIRLKAIQLGYTIPKTAIEKIGITRARVYVSGQNLLTITNYTGYDPEIGRALDGGSLFAGGIDARAYPVAKNVIFGVQLSF